MQITKNFNLNEFNSKCGRPMPSNVRANIIELAKNLQVLRDEVNRPISITSGYRSPETNAKVKRSKEQSTRSRDCGRLKVQGMTPKEVAPIIEKLIKDGKMKQGGIGIYPSWVHYDIRGTKAR
jgi:uncharacterized protein YcbK (DUF882 family)